MQKFLEFPITALGETAQLVAINGVVIVEQATPTTVTLTYGGAAAQDVVTITLGGAMAPADVTVRDRVQDSIIDALQTSWSKPKKEVSLAGLEDVLGNPVTITGIAIA
jgi:hypothetical protein